MSWLETDGWVLLLALWLACVAGLGWWLWRRRARVEPPAREKGQLADAPSSEDADAEGEAVGELAEATGPGAPLAEVEPLAATRYPVVLVHGVMGFDTVEVWKVRQQYFRGIVAHLEGQGVTVHVVRVDAVGPIQRRAEQLTTQIRALQVEQVNIVAHSMGGLDARYAISRLGLDVQVASLVTVGTPHRGTPLADTGTAISEKLRIAQLLGRLGLVPEAFWDITEHRMAAFNEDIQDVPGVFYGSYIGVTRPGSSPWLLASQVWLRRRVGGNDGLVPASSQRWGQVLAEIDACHWGQIGWAPGFDARGFYLGVCELLRSRGL